MFFYRRPHDQKELNEVYSFVIDNTFSFKRGLNGLWLVWAHDSSEVLGSFSR